MGSRRGGSFRALSGDSAAREIRRVRVALNQNKPARIVVATAIDVIAASNPTIGTLIATYKFSKFTYETASKAYAVYEKTGDINETLKIVAVETTKFVISETREQIIGDMVDIGWKMIKNSAGIETNEIQDRVLTKAAKNTLSEVLPK